jgi:hypothetical protein
MPIRRTLAVLAAVTGTLTAGTSQAAPANGVERARTLFLQAEADEDAERWSEALDKLRAVSQVKLTPGVRYHVALCEEHLGQLARALGDYTAAERQAREENAKDVLRFVGPRLAAIDARVPRLTIRVVPAAPDAAVTLDGELIAQGHGAAAIPVDPGVHHVEVTAPDRPTATAGVTLREHEWTVLDVHVAEPAGAASASITGPPPATVVFSAAPRPMAGATTPPRAPDSHAGAIVATALSIALLGGGAAAYIAAGSEHDHAVQTCATVSRPATDACSGWVARVRAWDFAATGAWTAALVSGVIAVVLWAKPNDAPKQAATRWSVGPGAIAVEGRF